jgi:hypothetical protein
MSVGVFSTGRDVSINLTTPGGTIVIPAGAVTSFKADPKYSEISSKGIDGVSNHAYIPDCWEGKIMIDRRNSSVDDYFATQEAAYYAGQTIANGTILETITEVDRSVNSYTFQNVAFKYANAGDWTADKKVDLEIDFKSSTRVKN